MTLARPVDMIDAGHRAVLHRKGEASLGFEPKREAECGADRAAMGDGDDVAAAMRRDQRVDGARHTLHDIDKTLAAGRPLMRRSVPEAVERAAARMAQFFIGQALPVAETL